MINNIPIHREIRANHAVEHLHQNTFKIIQQSILYYGHYIFDVGSCSKELITQVAKRALRFTPGIVMSIGINMVPLIFQGITKKFYVNEKESDELELMSFLNHLSLMLIQVGLNCCAAGTLKNKIKKNPSEEKIRGYSLWCIGNSLNLCFLTFVQYVAMIRYNPGSVGLMWGGIFSTAIIAELGFSHYRSFSNIEIVKRLIRTIDSAISTRLIKKNKIEDCTALYEITSLLILNSLQTMTPKEFMDLYGELAGVKNIQDPLISKKKIEELQRQLTDLTINGQQLLREKLAKKDSLPHEANTTLVALHKEISTIGYHVWGSYKDAVSKALHSMNENDENAKQEDLISKMLEWMGKNS